MADYYIVPESSLTATADAIREKTGSQENIDFNQNGFAEAVEKIHAVSTDTVSNDVMFYDYDGTVVYNYTAQEFLALNEMPANPTHAGLTSQGWNWSLNDAKAYVTSYGMIDIGQTYVTDDGKTRFYITINNDSNTDDYYKPFRLQFKTSAVGNTTIDWGDGTSEVTTQTAATEYSHTYTSNGDYIVTLSTSTGTYDFTQCELSGTSSNLFNAHRFNKIEIGSDARFGHGNWYTFKNMGNLETITIPQGATTYIGTAAFLECLNLKHITIPSGITGLYNPNGIEGSFKFCISLKSASVPNSVTDISSRTFYECKSLKRMCLPMGVTSSPVELFYNNTVITSIILPSCGTTIGSGCFEGCINLKSVFIPTNITAIGNSVFRYCYKIESVNIPSGVTSIGNNVFQECNNLKSIEIPLTTTSIGNTAFGECRGVKTIIGLDNVISLGADAFKNCIILESIDIPIGIDSLKSAAYQSGTFSSCRSLTDLVIPSNIGTIGNFSFYDCVNIKRFHLLATTPPTLSNANAFNNTTGIIYVPYSSDHSVLEAYQTATNWSTLSSRIQEEPQGGVS